MINWNYFLNTSIIVLSTLLISSRILNVVYTNKNVIQNILIHILLVFFISFASNISRIFNAEVDIFIIYSLCLIFIILKTKQPIGKITISIIISYAISIGLNNLALFSVSFIFVMSNIENKHTLFMIFIIMIINLLYTLLLLKVKRFKTTFPLLLDENFINITTTISITVLLCYIIITHFKENSIIVFSLVLFIIVFSVVLCILFYKETQNAYKIKLLTRNLESADNIIKSKDVYIKELIKNNDVLAKIIHKDNKLIPSMELALKNFMYEIRTNNPEFLNTSDKYIQQLDIISKERIGIIYQTEILKKNLVKIDYFSIDALMNYMFTKAINNNTSFNLIVNCNLKNFIGSNIEEETLRILLADIIDNAIISVKHSERKQVLLSFSVKDNFYEISIFDSGESFDETALSSLGVAKYTSHPNEGGSGIGMITVFEILKKHSASFILNEVNIPDNFSKCITICFDNKSRIEINTN